MNTTAQCWVDQTLAGAEPRSVAFRAGMVAGYKRTLHKTPAECPYRPGSAESDAFWAGTDHALERLRFQVAGGQS